jgi:hypothetical protein
LTDEYYRQCKLAQDHDGKHIETTTWIPEKHAQMGSTMKIKPVGSDDWCEGRWTIIFVGSYRKTKSEVRDRISVLNGYRSFSDK